MAKLIQIESYLPSKGPLRPQPVSTRGSKPNALQQRVIARLWQKMAEIYGHRWTSAYGESASPNGALSSAAQTWAEGLEGLSLDELRHGFERIIELAYPWPPPLTEFRQLCRRASAPYHAAAPALPASTVSREEALAHVSQAKQRLRNGNASA